MSKKFLLGSTLILGVFLLSGCAISFNNKSTTPSETDRGIYKSTTTGEGASAKETWKQKVTLLTGSGKPVLINSVDVSKIIIDPKDSNTLYITTKVNGVYVSYDGAENWYRFPRQPKEMLTTSDLAIDLADTCNLYAVSGRQFFKSVNCGRDWLQMYYGNLKSDNITTIAIDWFNPNNIYAGTSQGNILKSKDYGASWDNIVNTDKSAVQKLLVDPRNSKIVYAATIASGIFKTVDEGKTWTQIKSQLSEFKEATKYKDLVFDMSIRDGLVLASKYGLLRTTNGGQDWSPIQLIAKANIYAVAVDPKNSNNIFFTTESTFAKTVDMGKNWTSQNLPTTKVGMDLIVDPSNSNVLYMGVTKIENK